MLAVDTNVVVRYLTADDPIQSPRARTLVELGPIFVCTTVMLETAWVLGSVYDRSPTQIASSLRSFAGLPTVTIEDETAMLQALQWANAGLDITDALHLARSRHCDVFATFDRALVKTAKRLGIGNARLP